MYLHVKQNVRKGPQFGWRYLLNFKVTWKVEKINFLMFVYKNNLFSFVSVYSSFHFLQSIQIDDSGKTKIGQLRICPTEKERRNVEMLYIFYGKSFQKMAWSIAISFQIKFGFDVWSLFYMWETLNCVGRYLPSLYKNIFIAGMHCFLRSVPCCNVCSFKVMPIYIFIKFLTHILKL